MNAELLMCIFEEKLWIYNVLANNLFSDSYSFLSKDTTPENVININEEGSASGVIEGDYLIKSKQNFLINKIFRNLNE